MSQKSPDRDNMFIEKSTIQFLSHQGQDVQCAKNTPKQQECNPFMDCRHRIKAKHFISSPRGRLIYGESFAINIKSLTGLIVPNYQITSIPNHLLQPTHLKIPTPNPHLIQQRLCFAQMLPCFALIPLGEK